MNNKFTVGILVTLIFFFGMMFGLVMSLSFSKTPEKLPRFEKQLKACQNVIEVDRKVIEASTNVIDASGFILTAILNNDIDSIELYTKQIEKNSELVTVSKKEVLPFLEICFKEVE